MSAATDGQFVKSPLWLVIALIFSYSFTRGKTGKPRKTDAAEEEQDRIKN